MKKKSPLITCAFSTYNSSKTIKKAVKSALNQNYKNIEILIVDDCSQDNTLKILEKLKEKYSVMRIYKNRKNLGIGAVRNRLIKKALGEYICFFDDDDVSMKNRIKEQLKIINRYEKENKIDINFSPLCYSNRIIFYTNQKNIECKPIFIDVLKSCSKRSAIALLSGDILPKYATSGSTATCTLFARKSTFLKLSGFNRSLRRYEDLDIAIRALKDNLSLINSKKILVYQYYTNTQDKYNSEAYEIALIKMHSKFLSQNGRYKFSINYAKMKHAILQKNIKFFIKSFFKLMFHNPLLLTKKLFASYNTFLFSFKNAYQISKVKFFE